MNEEPLQSAEPQLTDPTPVKRKRGRPPKFPRPVNGTQEGQTPKPSLPKTPRKLQIPDDSLSGSLPSDSEDSDIGGLGSPRHARKRRNSSMDRSMTFDSSTPRLNTRRSHRGRHVDITRELIVLLPEDDPRIALDIRGDAEWDELQIVLAEDTSGDWSDGEQQGHGHGHGTHSHGRNSICNTPRNKSVTDLTSIVSNTPAQAGSASGAIPAALVKESVFVPMVREIPSVYDLIQQQRPSGSTTVTTTQTQSATKKTSNRRSQQQPLITYPEEYEDTAYYNFDLDSDDEEVANNIFRTHLSFYAQPQKADITPAPPSSSSAAATVSEDSFRKLFGKMLCRLERDFQLRYVSQREDLKECNAALVRLQELQSLCLQQHHAAKLFYQSNGTASKHLDRLISLQYEPVLKIDTQGSTTGSATAPPSTLNQNNHNSSNNSVTNNNNTTSSENDDTVAQAFKELQLFSTESLALAVGEERALQALSIIMQQQYPATRFSSVDISAVTRAAFDHWLRLRSQSKQSLLRAFHIFIMPLWSLPEKTSRPSVQDYDIHMLQQSYLQLQMIRKDLDRGRLIVDRVRRRERIKRDLLRTAGEFVTSEILFEDEEAQQQQQQQVQLGQAPNAPPVRKRGRPRRSDSVTSDAGVGAQHLVLNGHVNGLQRAATTPTVKATLPSKAPGQAEAPIRDKFGKFAKKSSASSQKKKLAMQAALSVSEIIPATTIEAPVVSESAGEISSAESRMPPSTTLSSSSDSSDPPPSGVPAPGVDSAVATASAPVPTEAAALVPVASPAPIPAQAPAQAPAPAPSTTQISNNQFIPTPMPRKIQVKPSQLVQFSLYPEMPATTDGEDRGRGRPFVWFDSSDDDADENRDLSGSHQHDDDAYMDYDDWVDDINDHNHGTNNHPLDHHRETEDMGSSSLLMFHGAHSMSHMDMDIDLDFSFEQEDEMEVSTNNNINIPSGNSLSGNHVDVDSSKVDDTHVNDNIVDTSNEDTKEPEDPEERTEAVSVCSAATSMRSVSTMQQTGGNVAPTTDTEYENEDESPARSASPSPFSSTAASLPSVSRTRQQAKVSGILTPQQPPAVSVTATPAGVQPPVISHSSNHASPTSNKAIILPSAINTPIAMGSETRSNRRALSQQQQQDLSQLEQESEQERAALSANKEPRGRTSLGNVPQCSLHSLVVPIAPSVSGVPAGSTRTPSANLRRR